MCLAYGQTPGTRHQTPAGRQCLRVSQAKKVRKRRRRIRGYGASRVPQKPAAGASKGKAQLVDHAVLVGAACIRERPVTAVKSESRTGRFTKTPSVRGVGKQLLQPVGSVAALLVAFRQSHSPDLCNGRENPVPDCFD